MNYYPRHIGDWMSATAHLSVIEECMYSRMVDLCYMREGPLPTDTAMVCRLVRASSAVERAAVATVLAEFFTQQDDGWHQKRCDEEIAKWKEKAAKASKSAKNRWDSGNANAMRTHSERNANAYANAMPALSEGDANQEPRTKNQRESAEIPAAKSRRSRKTPIPDGFCVSDRVRSWAIETRRDGLLDQRLEHFASKCRAHDYRYVDWDEAFMEAVRKDWAGLDGKVTAMTQPKRVAL